jgi:hypothetical protein
MIKVSPVVRQELVFSKKNENPLDYISISDYIMTNKTCQGYARKCNLKPAGFSFLAGQYNATPLRKARNNLFSVNRYPSATWDDEHGEFNTHSRKLYNSMIILLHFMDIIAPQHHWRSRLKSLITLYAVPVAVMGFPQDWQQRSIWQVQP